MQQGDKPVAQLAIELGISRNRLYKWRDALEVHGSHALPVLAIACSQALRTPVHRSANLSVSIANVL
jgi:transposase-like protein